MGGWLGRKGRARDEKGNFTLNSIEIKKYG